MKCRFFNVKFRVIYDASRYKIKHSRETKSTTYCRTMSKNTVKAIWVILVYFLLKSNLICPTYFHREENLTKISLLFKYVVLHIIRWKPSVSKTKSCSFRVPKGFLGKWFRAKESIFKVGKIEVFPLISRVTWQTATHFALDRGTLNVEKNTSNRGLI